jgi:hypothetical protein
MFLLLSLKLNATRITMGAYRKMSVAQSDSLTHIRRP